MQASSILIVGNSINQLAQAKSWADVLADLRKAARSPDCMRGDFKPYTIYFEELYWRARSAGVTQSSFLRDIAAQFSAMKPTDYHRRLLRLRVAHFLTTNYDYSLELCQAPGVPKVELKDRWSINESKFSLFRRNKIGDSWIWHIHGEANVPSSIMLGHDHYVNYAGQLREYWNRGVSYDSVGKVTRALKNHTSFDGMPAPFTWLDLFVRDRVHICGLSFDFSEAVLWYALSRRRVLVEASSCAGDMADVIYHYFDKGVPDPLLNARLEVMRSFGLRCVPHEVVGHDYEAAWTRLIDYLEREIGIRPAA